MMSRTWHRITEDKTIDELRAIIYNLEKRNRLLMDGIIATRNRVNEDSDHWHEMYSGQLLISARLRSDLKKQHRYNQQLEDELYNLIRFEIKGKAA